VQDRGEHDRKCSGMERDVGKAHDTTDEEVEEGSRLGRVVGNVVAQLHETGVDALGGSQLQ
jgi:hypothetical protein